MIGVNQFWAQKLNQQLLGKTHVTLYYPDQLHTQDNKDLRGSANDAYIHGEQSITH